MNNRRTGWFLTALLFAGLVAASVATAQKNDQAEVLLQAAFHKQLVDGDLEEAIQLYKSIIANHASNRVVAAKALVQMGQCYEKLGKTEARKAYELVLRDYADQREQVTIARARLAALTPASPAVASGMVARQVWAGPGVNIFGGPSPDGRYLTFFDWETGDLAIRDLASGEKRRLTNKGSWYESKEYVEYSRVSPDGKQVAYVWSNKDFAHELRLIGIDGSDPRVFYQNDQLLHIQPYEWSPDGRHILALFHKKDRTNQIVLVSIADGSVGVLKSLDWRYPVKMSLSPDGRYIVYDFPPREDSPERDIFLLATDGSREIPLIQHPANDLFPLWAPDGKRVLFASDRTGSMGAWVIQVAEGKTERGPKLVKRDMGRMFPMEFTQKGSYYYALFAGTRDVYTATLDPATGTVLSPPTPVSERFVGLNTSPDWSPDGKYLAYVSQRGPVPAIPYPLNEFGSRIIIVIRSVETGDERELTPKITSDERPRPRWSPDGRSLLVIGKDDKDRPGLYRVDAQSGDVTRILRGEKEGEIQHAILSPDGRAIFYVRADSNGLRILVRDLETGQEKELYRAPVSPSSLALSPDGRSLAFAFQDPVRRDVLMVLPAAGGEPRELFPAAEGFAWIGILEWTPDGRHLVFGKRVFREWKIELWRISAEGGPPQRLGLAMYGLGNLRFHPDGQRIAFAAGNVRAEVWVMENFLPELKAAE